MASYTHSWLLWSLAIQRLPWPDCPESPGNDSNSLLFLYGGCDGWDWRLFEIYLGRDRGLNKLSGLYASRSATVQSHFPIDTYSEPLENIPVG